MDQYTVTGMSCAACQARVEKAVSKVPGVTSCSVSLLTNSMGVEGTASQAEIIKAVENAGYGASAKGAQEEKRAIDYAAQEEALKDHETPKLKRRLIFSVGFLVVLMYITMGHNMWGWPLPDYFTHNVLGLALTQMILAAIVMLINHKFFTSGFSSLLHGSPNMDTLVALGASVSFVWSTFVFYKMCGMAATGADHMELMDLYHNRLYYESAAMIPALITVGKMLEAMSKGRTTNALKSLLRLAPKTAVLVRDGVEVEVGIDEVKAGDIFVVRPGGSIPVDGIVIEGESAVNEAALTGESIPVDKAQGDKVSAATINQSGFLRCQAERVGEDTTLSQIIKMVSEAAATKAPIARIADKVSGIFVPAVIGIAIIVIICWLISGQSLSFALGRAISVLVISCPCALGLATPVAIMVGNGLGAKNGILFKTSEALETAGRIDIIALDKTGTITQGLPEVTDLYPAEGVGEEELVRIACAMEEKSEHPLAKAVVREWQRRSVGQEVPAGRYCEKSNSLSEDQCGESKSLTAGGTGLAVTDFKVLPGSGLEACVEGKKMHAGNRSLIQNYTAITPQAAAQADLYASAGKTPLFFEADGRLLGIIAVADVIKQDSAEAVRQLKKMGIEVVMLTGDNEKTARAIGAQVGVDEVVAGVLPDGKEAVIRKLQERGQVAMVGDGINDAPALTRADIGIAIGAGTDVAIDSADVVLMNSTLTDVAGAIRLSRCTLRNIHQNLFWAFIYNIICIPLAAGAFVWEMNPMIAAAAMSLSSFTVCMNALRLNLFKLADPSHDKPLRKQKKKAADRAKIQSTNDERIQQTDAIDSNQQIEERKNKMEKTVRIDGMMCPHCEANVKAAMEALENVEAAAVSHEKGTAVLTLSADVDNELIKKTVEDKGYTFIGIE